MYQSGKRHLELSSVMSLKDRYQNYDKKFKGKGNTKLSTIQQCQVYRHQMSIVKARAYTLLFRCGERRENCLARRVSPKKSASFRRFFKPPRASGVCANLWIIF